MKKHSRRMALCGMMVALGVAAMLLGSVIPLAPAWIENAEGERVDATPHPMMQYTIPCEAPLMPYSLIRMQKKAE